MQKATAIYHSLAIFVLMTAFFVLQPSGQPEVAGLQTEIKQQLSVAWQQTLGDRPYFDDLANIYDGITAFYDQASNQTTALLSQPDSDEALYYVFHATYEEFVRVFQQRQVHLAQGADLPDPDMFMTEQALNNIIPDGVMAAQPLSGSVGGAVIVSNESEPVNKEYPWVTIQDNFTGQKYCLAVYNGEVNKYLGPCKSEYH